jgi:hypothetical protein
MKQRCLTTIIALLVTLSTTGSGALVTQAIKIDNFGYRPAALPTLS